MENDIPEAKLLASVVALAVRDCCEKPSKLDEQVRLSFNAATALDFIFTSSCEGYLEMLDIDPVHFRKALLKMMADTSPNVISNIDSSDRRLFRQNYAIWSDLHERLGGRVVDDQSKDWTFA